MSSDPAKTNPEGELGPSWAGCYCDMLTLLCFLLQLLVSNFNPAAADGLMCHSTVSVGWDGRIYDCDFNQQLALGMR